MTCSSSSVIPRRVLIPIDKSEHSERALKFYFENTMKPNDHLILFHSIELPSMPVMAMGEAGADEWARMMRDEKNKAESLKAQYEKLVEDEPVTVEFEATDQNHKVGENACKAAKEKSANLIVIGSRGMGKVRRTVLGSVSDYILHHAHLPILIVPPEHRPSKSRQNSITSMTSASSKTSVSSKTSTSSR